MTQAKYTFFAGAVAALLCTGVQAAPVKAKTEKAVAHAPSVTVKAEPLHKTANLSYQVAGKRYYPKQKVTSFSQTGKASWYGPGFHGRKTSTGEVFDMNELTAAHPTLPIPSYVQVTNLGNGKSVIVRVNDRGPFHGSRVIDVSKAAAKKLGFLGRGTAQVRVEQIVPGKRSEPAAAAKPGQTAI